MITSFPLNISGAGQGDMASSGVVNELSISGNGFFIVRDPATGELYATQGGHFSLNADSYLVTRSGARLQGRVCGSGPAFGDIQINAPGATMLCYSIDERGRIFVHLNDGTSFVRAQIMLQNFEDPQALVQEGDCRCSNILAAGPLPALAQPGSVGLGFIQWGVLELDDAAASHWTN